MFKSLMLFVFVYVVVCNGELPTPLLDAIINGATRIRSGIHNAGEALINGITHRHGGMLNIGGNLQINKDRQDPYMYPPPPRNPETNGDNQKTVIYVIEKQGSGPETHDYGPYQPNGGGPPPHYGPPGTGFPHGHGHPVRPGYEHRPYYTGPNYGQNNQPNENTKQENKPNYNNNVNDDKKLSMDGQTLEHDGNKTKDGPTRVPLNPNEVNYNEDKTANNAPKREASKTDEAADDDQEYNIDVRFNNNE